MSETLKPCPFCGGEAEIVKGDESAYVQCKQVKMHRALWFDGDNNAAGEVADQWNTRAAPPAPPPATELVEVLEDAREALGQMLDKDFGIWSSPTMNEPRSRAWAAYKALEAALAKIKEQSHG